MDWTSQSEYESYIIIIFSTAIKEKEKKKNRKVKR